MTNPVAPFAMPARFSAELGRVNDYWNGLKRGENKIPFADDLKLSALRGVDDRAMLIDVFEQPQRFRFAVVGAKIRQWYGGDLVGRFADEVDDQGPLAYLRAQASATVEAAQPTYFKNGCSRLVLPFWGNGYISTLLAVALQP